MRNRVKKLEDKAKANKKPLKFYVISKDEDFYFIPTELITLLGRDPLEFEKSEFVFLTSGDNVKVGINPINPFLSAKEKAPNPQWGLFN